MLVPAPYFVFPLLPLNFRWLPRHTAVAGGSTRQSLLFLAKLRKKEATRTLFIGVKLHSKLKFGCCTILYSVSEILYLYVKITTTTVETQKNQDQVSRNGNTRLYLMFIHEVIWDGDGVK